MAPSKTNGTIRHPSSSPPTSIPRIFSHQDEPPEHPPPADDFSARRSGRVATGQCVADNDTWVEALAVCEMAKDPKKSNANSKSGSSFLKKLKSRSNAGGGENANADTNNTQQQHEAEMAMAAQRLTLRPYFQSQNTAQRVWDEPPSGASNIIYATANARKMAQAQLEEMRATYAHAALVRKSEREAAIALERSFAGERSSSRKLSLPKLFKRSSSSVSETEARSMSTPLVTPSNSDSAQTGIPPSVLQESVKLATDSAYEHDLQMAMMLSMGIGKGSVMGVGDHASSYSDADAYSSEFASASNCTAAAAARREKEHIAMAKALSMADEEACGRRRKSEKSKKKHATSHYASLKSDEAESNFVSQHMHTSEVMATSVDDFGKRRKSEKSKHRHMASRHASLKNDGAGTSHYASLKNDEAESNFVPQHMHTCVDMTTSVNDFDKSRKSEESKHKHIASHHASLKNDGSGSNFASRHADATSAPPPTLHQIETDFDVDCNGKF